MMHVSKEFLLEAVGLTLLVGLLLLGTQMFQRATDLIDRFDQEQERKIAAMEEYEIYKYDGRKIDGIAAHSYIKNLVYHYEIPVRVETTERIFMVEDETICVALGEEQSEYYMQPFALYECVVNRDENNGIESVWLTEMEGE